MFHLKSLDRNVNVHGATFKNKPAALSTLLVAGCGKAGAGLPHSKGQPLRIHLIRIKSIQVD
jgi:hypothetical protein